MRAVREQRVQRVLMGRFAGWKGAVGSPGILSGTRRGLETERAVSSEGSAGSWR